MLGEFSVVKSCLYLGKRNFEVIELFIFKLCQEQISIVFINILIFYQLLNVFFTIKYVNFLPVNSQFMYTILYYF